MLVRKRVNLMFVVIGGLAAAGIFTLSGMLYSHDDKRLAIWTFFVGAALALFIACKVWSDSVRESKDEVVSPPAPSVTPAPPAAQLSASPPNSPSVVPSSPDTSPLAVSPFSSVVSPSPRESPLPKLTPLQMMDRVKNASLYNRDDVASGFVKRPFDWPLPFFSASRIGINKERLLVSFLVTDDSHFLNFVRCNVPTERYGDLPATEPNTLLRVRGTIERVGIIDMDIKDASIDHIPSSLNDR